MNDRAEQIRALHGNIVASFKRSKDDAIEIGRLLHEQKAELGHGKFGPWLEANVLGPTFSRSLANKYMKLYEQRDQLQIRNVPNITAAIRVAYAETKDQAMKGLEDDFEDADDLPPIALVELAGTPDAVKAFNSDVSVLIDREKAEPLAAVHTAVRSYLNHLEKSDA